MERKNGLKIWQFIVMIVLQLVLLITAVIPAFHYNGDVMQKMHDKASQGGGAALAMIWMPPEFLYDAFKPEFGAEEAAALDEEIQTKETEMERKISSVSPIHIIGRDAAKFFLGNKTADQEALEEYHKDTTYMALEKTYNSIRLFLIVIYLLDILALIFTIIAFAVKMNKTAAASVNLVFALIACGMTAYLRFFLAKGLAEGMASALTTAMQGLDTLGKAFGVDGKAASTTTGLLADILSQMYGVAFLIMLAVAVVLLIWSVVSLLTGNAPRQSWQDEPMADMGNAGWGDEQAGDGWNGAMSEVPVVPDSSMAYDIPYAGGGSVSADWNNQEQERIRQERLEEERIRQEEQQRQMQAQAQSAAMMGVVQCIKGPAIGQGFSIPADRKVIIGKSTQRANFVVNETHISNVHCSIRYNPQNGMYTVIDHSSNGTYVNGNRIQKDMPMMFPTGTIICLANENNQIKLGQ